MDSLMICIRCGKGEYQELTGTNLLVCPICSSKLIQPTVVYSAEDVAALISQHEASRPQTGMRWTDQDMMNFACQYYEHRLSVGFLPIADFIIQYEQSPPTR